MKNIFFYFFYTQSKALTPKAIFNSDRHKKFVTNCMTHRWKLEKTDDLNANVLLEWQIAALVAHNS